MTEVWIILGIVAVLVFAALGFLVATVISAFKRQWAKSAVRFVVAVLFFVLAGLILPMAAVPRPHHSRRNRCMSNLSQMGKACVMYAMDHDEALPSSFLSLTNYVNQPRLFVCPWSETKPGPIDTVNQWADYILVTNLTAGSDSDLVLAYCKPENHAERKGVNVLFVDGSVTWVRTEDFGQVPCDIMNHERVSGRPQQSPAR